MRYYNCKAFGTILLLKRMLGDKEDRVMPVTFREVEDVIKQLQKFKRQTANLRKSTKTK